MFAKKLSRRFRHQQNIIHYLKKEKNARENHSVLLNTDSQILRQIIHESVTKKSLL